MSDACQEFGLFFLFLSFSSSLSDPVYKAIGGDAVLKLPLMDLPIQHIEWKYNEDIAADWHGKEFECFGQFTGRCELNSGTGALTITGLNLNDSGIYTPEINGRVLNKIELSVISRVPKPSVKTSCNTEMTRCILTCEGNTTNAKPVIYKWFLDGRDGPLQDDLFITQETKKNRFRCMMRNPVSNETSESFINPFIEQIYGAKGEDVILRPPSMTDTIKIIEWKHNEDIAAEWYGKKSECLGQFEARCELNTDSGALTIKGLNLNDSGIYTPEINGRDSSKTHLSVISRVAKPSIKTSCNAEMTSCDLTCEGNTAESEPITYSWFIDGRDGPSDKVLTITEDTKEESFRCLMMNPVSNETSESITNPIKEEQDQRASIIAAVVIVLVLVIVIAAFFIYKCIRVKQRKEQRGTKHEMKALNRPAGDEDTESKTTETSSNSPAEAAASDADQSTGRCEVNSGTGALTITGLNLNDSGIYTPEINSRVLNKIKLSVISRVPKPSVKTSCNTEMTRCNLTCEGNTTNAKPVIHKWFLDGRDGPSQDDLFITQETKKNSFRCIMKNPVSNETSESFINPFIKQLYGAKGEDVILRPPSMTDTIKIIEWKHNEDIAAEWYGKKSECLGQFEETESMTPDTSYQSVGESVFSDTEQETALTSVVVRNAPTCGPLDTDKRTLH